MEEIVKWSNSLYEGPKSKQRIIIALKGGDLNDELNKINYVTNQFLIADYFSEKFFDDKKVVITKLH